MLLTNKTAQAKHAETDPRHGTPAMAYFQTPDSFITYGALQAAVQADLRWLDTCRVYLRSDFMISIRNNSNLGSQIPYPIT